MSNKRGRSPSLPPAEDIFRSSTIEEQKSIFTAAFSATLSATALQRLPEFKSATHRIAAWRKPSRQKSLMPESKVLYDVGFDDDGEKWAGTRLKHVLEDTNVAGAVVVARWYGGQNIGPIRFTHIESVAKEAIWNFKVADAEAKKELEAKKQKMDEEAARKELEENLRERDLNIFVLRGLLAEKNAKLNGGERVPPTPQKAPPDYGKMSLEALKRVDKARDATIAFILKEIDKVDEQLKMVEALDEVDEADWKDLEEKSAAGDAPPKEDEKNT
ncbi:uncharacterized protein EI97DRAFT_13979 [Westerdykella ornata]|uniref:Impact N-terminal domain-containing protein n=1 Tax=Westerdykella ornata TaxID=318751 RepID=A0A6A6JWY8_WESOR|nr:uncharacterized protein EI97DRAFT_13979 [Westerdykella ornata]KAF2280927.1 hypothetical protein EI97DRAFT_13979 [Westerdykella ornata]